MDALNHHVRRGLVYEFDVVSVIPKTFGADLLSCSVTLLLDLLIGVLAAYTAGELVGGGHLLNGFQPLQQAEIDHQLLRASRPLALRAGDGLVRSLAENESGGRINLL